MFLKYFFGFYITAVAIVISIFALEASNNTHRNQPRTNRRKWISEMLSKTENIFDMNSNVSSECERDFQIYKLHAQNQTVWAVRMVESSEWPRKVLFTGEVYHLGNYEECLRSRGPGIRGQYCLVRATYNLSWSTDDEPIREETNSYSDSTSGFEMLKMSPAPEWSLNWAICIPSSCSAADLQSSLDNALKLTFEKSNFHIAVTVSPNSCEVQSGPQYLQGVQTYKYSKSVLAFLVTLVIAATLFDLTTGRKQVSGEDVSVTLKLFRSFSAIQNYQSLVRNRSTIEYPFLDFLKVVFMFNIIRYHRDEQHLLYPKYENEDNSVPGMSASLLSNQITMHVFFMISGFLATFYDSFVFKKSGSSFIRPFLQAITFRWLRMVPASGLLLLCVFASEPKETSGPLSKNYDLKELQHCKSSWWMNMLVVQNYLNLDEMCLPHSWYIAVDIQLFAIGVILVAILRRNRRQGVLLIVAIFICKITYIVMRYDSTSFGRPEKGISFRDPAEWYKYRTMLAHYLGPYLTGIVTAVWTKFLMEQNYQFSRVLSVLLPVSLLLVRYGVGSFRRLLFTFGPQYDLLTTVIYGGIFPTLGLLPIASLICIYFVSGFGFLNRFFELKLFTILGRLGYCMYLIGLAIQYDHTWRRSTLLPGRINTENVEHYWMMTADTVIITSYSFIFFLISEGPLNCMTTLLRQYLVKEQKKSLHRATTNSGKAC